MNLISLKDWNKETILEIIDYGLFLKKNSKQDRSRLSGKFLALLFQKTSTRTRVSFEVAMQELGGSSLFLDWQKSNFILSDLKDEVRSLAGYVQMIVARLLKQKDLETLAKFSGVPIINGCSEQFHPCQILSDLLTIKETLGKIEGIHLVYTGIHNNIANSLILASSHLGFYLTLCTPEFHIPCQNEEVMNIAKESPFIQKNLNLKFAVKEADIVYTDSWVDMELFLDPKFEAEKTRRLERLLPYQVNAENLKGSKAKIMHDMPIHEGYEISRQLIESEQSIIFQQSQNRLPTQKALLVHLFESISKEAPPKKQGIQSKDSITHQKSWK